MFIGVEIPTKSINDLMSFLDDKKRGYVDHQGNILFINKDERELIEKTWYADSKLNDDGTVSELYGYTLIDYREKEGKNEQN